MGNTDISDSIKQHIVKEICDWDWEKRSST